MSAVTTLKNDEQDFDKAEKRKTKGAAADDASDDDDDDDAEFLARMRNRSDPAVKMLHNLGFGDGDEEPSEVA